MNYCREDEDHSIERCEPRRVERSTYLRIHYARNVDAQLIVNIGKIDYASIRSNSDEPNVRESINKNILEFYLQSLSIDAIHYLSY